MQKRRIHRVKRPLFAVLGLALLLALCACAGSARAASSGAAAVSPGTSPDSTAAAQADTGGKSLVVYFSATGNTEKVAQEIAAQTGADVFKLVPAEPYTAADLDYGNDACRANLEQNDANARPGIAGELPDLSGYDTVYLGFPIWWGTMPRIINTLLDGCDFSGKTVLPFCTSGGSGISTAVEAIRSAEPDAEVKDGLRLSGSAANDCTEAVAAWLKENGVS